MITLIVILLSLSAVMLFYLAAANRRRPGRAIRPVDLTAFHHLINREDEFFLRERLPSSSFRRLKRQRIAVTLKYLGRIAGNSSAVMRLGEAARLSPEPEISQAAAQLIELAAQIRLQCMVAFAKLSLEFAVPSLQLTPAVLAPQYQALRENMRRLASLQMQDNAAALPVAI
jgi:hypothetical protein